MAKGGAGQVVGIAGVALVGYWILRVALPKIQTQQAQAGVRKQPASGGGNGVGYSPLSGVLAKQARDLALAVDLGNADAGDVIQDLNNNAVPGLSQLPYDVNIINGT